MNINEQDKRALRILAIFFALLLVYFALSPWIDDWTQTRQRVVSAQAQLVKMKSQVIQLTNQHRRLTNALGAGIPGDPQKISPDQSASMGLLTVEQTRLQSIEMAEGLLKSGGLKIIDVQQQQIQAIRELPGKSLVTFKVEGTGRFDQLPKCLAAIRKAPHLLLIHKLDVKADSRKPGNISLTLILGTLAITQGDRS